MNQFCLRCEKSIPENESASAYCYECALDGLPTDDCAMVVLTDWSPLMRNRPLPEGSPSEASSSWSDWDSRNTIPSDSDSECLDDVTSYHLLKHPLYNASPRYLAMASKNPPVRLKAPLLLPIPSAPPLSSTLVAPLMEPLSLPLTVPFFSSARTAASVLASTQEINHSRMLRRNTDSAIKRPGLRQTNKAPTREATRFYLGSEDESDAEDPVGTKPKQTNSGVTTPKPPQDASFPELAAAGDAVRPRREGPAAEMRRGRSREVSMRALSAAARTRGLERERGSLVG